MHIELDVKVHYQAGPPLSSSLLLLPDGPSRAVGGGPPACPSAWLSLGGYGDPPPQALAPYDGPPAVVGLYPTAVPRLWKGRHMPLPLPLNTTIPETFATPCLLYNNT